MHPVTYRRFLWGAPPATQPLEINRVERTIANTRVFLAVTALALFFVMDAPTLSSSSSRTMYGLLGLYIFNSVVVLILLRRRKPPMASFRALVHGIDIVWPAFISVFAVGPRSPFFLFFVFVLTTAAYRWGLWGTLGTATAELALLWTEGFVLLRLGAIREGSFFGHALSYLRFNATEFEPKRLFVFSLYLLLMALLLGCLTQRQNHRQV